MAIGAPNSDLRPFVGRASELTKLQALLAQERIVQVNGPPGVGKTRLLTHYAHHADHRVTRVDGPVLDANAIQASLDKADVLWFDNVEQSLAELPNRLDALLAERPHLRIVVTSRLRVVHPTAYRLHLGPLDVGDAVNLFVARARRHRDLDVADPSVSEILPALVQALDCLPLALELAAERAATRGLSELLRQPVGPDSLQDALEVTWDCLQPWERAAWAQIAVFPGSFSAAAAEAVLDAQARPPGGSVDVVATLVDHSLVRAFRPEGLPQDLRLECLHSVRAFLAGRVRPEHQAALEARFAKAVLNTCRPLKEALNGPQALAAIQRLELERPNLEAITHTFEAVQVLDALLRRQGPPEVHCATLEAAERLDLNAREQAWLDEARGQLALQLGELDDAESRLKQAVRAGQDLGVPELQASAWWGLGEVAQRRGTPEQALACSAQIERLAQLWDLNDARRQAQVLAAWAYVDAERLPDARRALEQLDAVPPSANLSLECRLLKRLAYVHYFLRNFAEQHRLNAQALALARQVGDRRMEALALQGLGETAFSQADFQACADYLKRAGAIHLALGHRHYRAVLLGNLGAAYHRLDQQHAARNAYREALALHRELKARPYEAAVLYGLATLEAESGALPSACSLFMQATGLYETLEQFHDLGNAQICLAMVYAMVDNPGEARVALAKCADLPLAPDQRRFADAVGIVVNGAIFEAGWRTRLEELVAATTAVRPWIDTIRWIAELTVSPGSAALQQAEAHRRYLDHQDAGPSLRQRSLQVRLAACWLDHAVERARYRVHAPAGTPSAPAALTIGPEGTWFQRPGGGRVELRRRRALRLILDRLARLHHQQPGAGIDVYDMFEVGWPGESAAPETAAARVYWAIRSLRKLGLEDVILTSDAGYILDPHTTVDFPDPTRA